MMLLVVIVVLRIDEADHDGVSTALTLFLFFLLFSPILALRPFTTNVFPLPHEWLSLSTEESP
jgi:hypothetical protein